MAKETNSRKVVTGQVRFSYVNVFKPRAVEEGEREKYSVAILIDKSDTKTIKKCERAIAAALEQGTAKFGGKVPKNYKNPLRDGDEDREDDEAFENKMFINCSSVRKPAVVDEMLDPIMDADEFYSGCYGRASVDFYAFNFNGSKGVACGINGLQKLKDGENLGGANFDAEEDFG